MTRATNARVAGATLLLYIGVGITQMTVLGGTSAGATAAERLATLARHAAEERLDAALSLLTCLFALTLGVTLYALTRDQDEDLALLALACRVAEGVVGAASIPISLGLLALASAAGTGAPDAAATGALATFVFATRPWNPPVAASFFAVGSTLFSWLLLRGRTIPVWLAWLGVAASVLLVVALPLQLAGGVRGTAGMLVWLPMAAFEIPLGIWFLVKGAAAPAQRSVPTGA